MISLEPTDKLFKEYCKYGVECGKVATNICQGCGQVYCMKHYREHQRKLQDLFEYVIHMQYLFKHNFNLFMSQSSTEATSDLKKEIHELKMKSNETEAAVNVIQQRFQGIITTGDTEVLKKPLFTTTEVLDPDQNDYFENDIQLLKKDMEDLKTKLSDISMNNQIRLSQGKEENGTYPEGEEMIEVNGSNTASKVTHKVRLAHNYIRWIRGPAKVLMNGITDVVDIHTQGKYVSDAVLQAVMHGLAKQQTNNSSFELVFAEITPAWMFEGENVDRGFISASVWMHDPQDRRILVKIQGHPLCAVNEWLAYIIGRELGLPVNEVQIAIYQNKLVTLHTDIAHENEKTIVFMDLPKEMGKALLTYPIMESMDLFDHIIQNVDRTPRNILITMPNTIAIADDTTTLKIHLIDHSFCFGVGKRCVVGPIACKFQSKHFSVAKFDPIHEGRKFEQHLNQLPILDRTLTRKTLNRFAAFTNDQFSSWMTEICDLLSSSQYIRIHDVLCRKRDIARYYAMQRNIFPDSP